MPVHERLLAAPAVAVALALGAASAWTAASADAGRRVTSARVSDDAGDAAVRSGDPTPAQRRSVDLLRVRVAASVADSVPQVEVVARYDDLIATGGAQVALLKVKEKIDGARTIVVLVADTGSTSVYRRAGDDYGLCEGATAVTDVTADTMTWTVPTSCLAGFERPRFKLAGGLYDRVGMPTVTDAAKRTPRITLPAS